MFHVSSILAQGGALKEGWRLEDGVLTGPVPGGPAGLVHGFTTRAAGDQSPGAGADALARRFGAARLRMLQQVHGTELLSLAAPGERPEADGWVGPFLPGQLMAVRTADCLPVLLWHEEEPLGAAVHAGWRGAVAGICRGAVERLGGDPSKLFALLGPCIGKCCFEVGEDVAAAAGNDPRWITPGKTELGVSKYLFDLSGYAEADLLRAGLSPERIFASGLCTRCRQDLFFSHRGGETVKRMAAFIGLQGGLA